MSATGLSLAIIALASQEGCAPSGTSTSGRSRGGSASKPVRTGSAYELKVNPTDVETAIRARSTTVQFTTQSDYKSHDLLGRGNSPYNGWGVNRWGQYINVGGSYTRKDFQNIGIKAGDYVINGVTLEEDAYSVDHYSPITLTQNRRFRYTESWWTDDSDYGYYDPAPPPPTRRYNPAPEAPERGYEDNDNGGGWGWPSSTPSRTPEAPENGYDDTPAPSSSGGGWFDGGSTSGSGGYVAPEGGYEDNSWSGGGDVGGGSYDAGGGYEAPEAGYEDNILKAWQGIQNNIGGNLGGAWAALTGSAEAYPVQHRIVYVDNGNADYFQLGVKHYTVVTTAPNVTVGYQKDVFDWMSDVNETGARMTIYYTYKGQPRTAVMTEEAPLNSSATNWVCGNGEPDQCTATENDILGQILQGTYVPPAPPAPPATPVVPAAPESGYDDAAPVGETTTTTTTTTVKTTTAPAATSDKK